MSPPLLLVVGSVNYDLTFRHARLPRPGETVVGAEASEACGGKGANQAIAAARYARISGVPLRVAFAGAVGDDAFGRRQLEQLRLDGIDTAAVDVLAGERTGVSSIWVETGSGENRILNAPGANLRFPPERLAALPVAEAALVLLQNEIPAATTAAAAARARSASVPVVWDPAPFPPGERLPLDPRACAYVTPNETEASGLLGRALDPARPERDARELRELGFETVLLTLGAGGVAVATRDDAWVEVAPQVAAVDVTAAGDAFAGAFAVACLAGHGLRRAVREAVRYATASVTRAGAQPSFPATAEDLLAGAGGDTLRPRVAAD